MHQLRKKAVPAKAFTDAVHIAIAALREIAQRVLGIERAVVLLCGHTLVGSLTLSQAGEYKSQVITAQNLWRRLFPTGLENS